MNSLVLFFCDTIDDKPRENLFRLGGACVAVGVDTDRFPLDDIELGLRNFDACLFSERTRDEASRNSFFDAVQTFEEAFQSPAPPGGRFGALVASGVIFSL
jgi:hypothetical protein